MNAQQHDLNNPETRREVLLERLRVSGRLIATELVCELDVSGGTIRRDLLALEQEGRLRRVRGGALPPEAPARSFRERTRSSSGVIDALAQRASALVERGSCVLLDGGTTLVACARALPSELSLLVVTPSPSVAVAAHANGHEVITIGGQLGELGGSALGAGAERDIALCTADLCLLGTCSVDPQRGFGADSYNEASLKRTMLASAARTAVVASADKLGHRSRFLVCGLSDVDVLVTNAPKGQLADLPSEAPNVLHV